MKRSTKSNFDLTGMTYGRRLTLLFVTFMLMLCIMVLVGNFIGANTRHEILLFSALQCLLVFCMSSFVVAWFVSRKPMTFLGIRARLTWRNILGVIVLLALSIPAMNMLVYWNEHIALPDNAFTTALREMETSAQATTTMMMDVQSVSALLVNILVIGVLTGFSEELFFRGAVQRVIASGGMNHHAAIWISAFIFSLLHFQFFGFVPRLLLGAFFGYLMYWTGSIWVSSTAHAINNSIVVLVSWLSIKGYDTKGFEELGIAASGFPWLAVAAFVLFMVVAIATKGYFFKYKTRR